MAEQNEISEDTVLYSNTHYGDIVAQRKLYKRYFLGVK